MGPASRFSWCALAPRFQYAAARIRSIFRKAALQPAESRAAVTLTEPTERALALTLLSYGSSVAEVGNQQVPHRLAAYLFELAQAFTSFYDACPVLNAEDEAVRASRLSLTAAVLEVLVDGLGLLGLESPDRM